MTHPIEALFADNPGDELPDDASPPEGEGVELPKAASGAAAGRHVARAIKEGVIADVYEALSEAIAAGETLQTFTERVQEIARTKGWLATQTEQHRAWRAQIIFETNMRMHYQAERFRQLSEPSMMEFYPYWQYVHGQLRTPMRPRPEHVALDGLVIRADDPWWRKYFGPNGWGCTCGVRVVSRWDLTRMGKNAPDEPPKWGTVKYADPLTGETRDIPKGIDPGFDCTPVEWIERLPLRAKEMRQKAFQEAEKARAARPPIEVRL
ncbi:phage head morphogenesis protein [Methylocystis sp. S23]